MMDAFEKKKINNWLALMEARAEAYARVDSAFMEIDNASVSVGGLDDCMTQDERDKVSKLLAEAMDIVEAARDRYA